MSAAQRKPELHELDTLEGKNKTVRIIDRVAGVWKLVATRLYFECHDIMRIEKDCPFQGREACQQVMFEWQMGRGRKPTTWATLVNALDEADLSEIAKDIEDILGD